MLIHAYLQSKSQTYAVAGCKKYHKLFSSLHKGLLQCDYSSFLWDVESIFPNPLNMNLVICFDFMCLKFQIWRGQRLEKCLCCGVFPLLLLGILLSSYEWGWASLLHDGRCMAVPSADIELTPDMWRLLSPKSLPTARQVTEGIQDHPPQWVSLDNTIQLALEWYKCLLF